MRDPLAAWLQLATGVTCGLAFVPVAATGRAGHLVYGLLWASCVLLFVAPVAEPAPPPGTPPARDLVRRAAALALLGALLAGLVAAASLQLSGSGRTALRDLTPHQTILFAALCAAAAGPAALAGLAWWGRRPTPARAVAAGVLATLALTGWFAVAVAQVGYLHGVWGGLDVGLGEAMRVLSRFADEPVRVAYTLAGLAVPFGLVVAGHGCGLRGGRAALAVVVGTATWSGLLFELVRAERLGAGWLGLLGPPLLVALALVLWLGRVDARGLAPGRPCAPSLSAAPAPP